MSKEQKTRVKIFVFGTIIAFVLIINFWRGLSVFDNKTTEFFSLHDNLTIFMSAAAHRLPKNGSVFCWVMTSPKYHSNRVLAVNETWLPRCDHGEFFSTEPIGDESIPYSTVFTNMDDSCEKLFLKTRRAFYLIYNMYELGFDWYFKADDDTYVIWENLEAYLRTLDPQKPYFLGHTFKSHLKDGFQSGGAGYILSKAALKLFVEKAYFDQNTCSFDVFEDVAISRCLANIGILPTDTRNSNGQHRFNPTNSTTLFNLKQDDVRNYKWPWRRQYEVFAPEMITLHHVTPEKMRDYDIMRYRTKIDYRGN